MQRVIASQNRVNVNDRMWARLVSSTQQPEFTGHIEEAMAAPQEKQKAASFPMPAASNGAASKNSVKRAGRPSVC
jgi:uncharacterized protein (DUF1778 family)